MPARPYPFATQLREIPRACAPEAPLLDPEDERWVDFGPARGDQMSELLRRLEWRQADEPPIHAAVFSNRGAGKSTEIRRLVGKVAHAYHPLYLETDKEMDANSIPIEDLLVVIATRVEDRMREDGCPIDEALLKDVHDWFSSVIRQTEWARTYQGRAEAGAKGGFAIPFFGRFFADVVALFRQESTYREQVRAELKKFPGQLLDKVNRLLDAANAALGGRELLLILDNLDRYPPDLIDTLLVRNETMLRALRCCTIYTPPISLYFQPHTEPIDTLYECHLMSTVRLRRPDQPFDAFDGPGRALMAQALRQRMDLDTLIPHPATLDRLIAATGGAIRDLLDLVSQSAFLSEQPFIDVVAADKAVTRRRQRLRDLARASGFMIPLKRLHAEKQIFSDEGDACLRLLYYRLAFKYNGDGWYDVHPLIAELPEFAGQPDP